MFHKSTENTIWCLKCLSFFSLFLNLRQLPSSILVNGIAKVPADSQDWVQGWVVRFYADGHGKVERSWVKEELC